MEDPEHFEGFISYNQLMDYMEQHTEPEELADGYFKFREIKAHQGPLKPNHQEYKGCSYNILVEWKAWVITYERLSVSAADDRVSCAEYGKKHGLLDQPGWRRLKRFAKTSKRPIRAIKR